MSNSTNNENEKTKITKLSLFKFFSALIITRQSVVFCAIFFCCLIAGHITMPLKQSQFKEKMARDADFLLKYANTILDGLEEKNDSGHIKKSPSQAYFFYNNLRYNSQKALQFISTDEKYGIDNNALLSEEWLKICNAIVEGIRKDIVPANEDFVTYIGSYRLISSDIFSKFYASVDEQIPLLGPRYDRHQFLEDICGGTNIFSLLPFILIAMLTYNSFSIDYETGIYKLIETLPVPRKIIHWARTFSYALISNLMVFITVILAFLTYPLGTSGYRVINESAFPNIYDYANTELEYSAYILPYSSYLKKMLLMYSLELVIFSLFVLAISKLTRNSFISLTLPLSTIVFSIVANFSIDPNPHSIIRIAYLTSPHHILGGFALLPMRVWLLLEIGLSIAIIFVCVRVDKEKLKAKSG